MASLMVPSVEVLREMTDPELLKLKTDIAADLAMIQGQIRFNETERDDEWKRRTGMAAHYREQGLRTIKNVLAERQEAREVPLSAWMHCLLVLADAATTVIDNYEYDDDEIEWVTLDRAVEAYRNFMISIEMATEA